ncbi:family 1 glycosylhydrolase [Demequina aestuarii]|uniref:family 1 glycosylhydrolase n=1 Tax=Demequina aestuarii TaxID=327095 RepID=UPI000783BDC2|nr:family 1 glycosylhydrolase [Demequina aestuarii]
MTRPAFVAGNLTWALGIEDTCVYPVDPSRMALDEHVLTDHHLQWRSDLDLVAELGATALRYGVSWPRIHTGPGQFDWESLDQVVAHAVDDLGLTLVADLVHYGTPPWLIDSFADDAYPAAIEEFAGAIASRYRDRLTHFTPLNEPVTTASFCGLRGVWPPARAGWTGWVSVVMPIAVGMARAIHAIRRAQPHASIVHVEAATNIRTDEPDLDDHARLLTEVGWLPTDLLLGRVDASHPMHEWLLRHGARETELDWLSAHGTSPDIMGVNYYPDLTPRRLVNLEGQVVQVSYDRGARGLREALTGFHARYGLPLAVTETSVEGDDAIRARWLSESVDAVRRLSAEGVDVRGYTWWPMFDFVDWSWAAGGANVEEFAVAQPRPDGSLEIAPAPPLGDPVDGKTAFLRRMGVVRLEEKPDGTLERHPTRAAHLFTAAAMRPVGEGAA